MRTFIRLKNQRPRKLPPEFGDISDIRYADDLVATFLQRFTRPGDVVFDPFAGFGTTLLVAEAMNRAAWGVEFDEQRVQYIRSQLHAPEHIIHGDSRELARYDLPLFDFSITSPPYMTEHDDPMHALANYTTPTEGYKTYLQQLQTVYKQMRQLMKPNAKVVLEVSNLKSESGVTTLAWDVARAIGAVLRFEGEIVIGWDHYDYGYDHSYCLVFSQPQD
jgi:DNA modification methylase